MAWWRRKPDNPFGYEDRAALKGFGGYEPADRADATPSRLDAGGYEPADPAEATPSWLERLPQAPAPPRAPRKKRPTVPGVLVVGLLLAGGAVNLVTGILSDSSDEDDRSTATVTPRPYTPTPELQVVVPPVIEGWQSVAGRKGSYAYDVPPSWTPRPGMIHGWEADSSGPGIMLSTSALLDEAYCRDDPGRQRGGSGLTVVEQADHVQAATEAATSVATYAYTPEDGGGPPRLAVDDPEPATVSFGAPGQAASITLVEVTSQPGADTCLPDKALVGALAIEKPDSEPETVVLVVYAAQGYPGATTREELVRILGSLRGVPEKDRDTITPTPTP